MNTYTIDSRLIELYGRSSSSDLKREISETYDYSRWFQSPSIPQNSRLSLDNLPNDIGKEPSTMRILEKDWSTSVKSVPSFLPFEFHTSVYYTVSFRGRGRFLHALMTANEPTWSSFPEKTKDKIFSSFKLDICQKFSSLYTKNSKMYKHYSITRNDLYSLIVKETDISFHPVLLHIWSDFLDMNIFIVRKEGYVRCSSWDKDRSSLFFWDDDGECGCILHRNGTEHLRPCNMDHPVLFHMKDIDPEKTKKLMIAGCPPHIQKHITQLKKMNKKDLEYWAIRLNILENDDISDIKNIKKKELLDMICSFIAENHNDLKGLLNHVSDLSHPE